MRPRRSPGFSLVELAIVMAIVAIALTGVMQILAVQRDIQQHDETNRRLTAAVEAIMAFAIVNERLPCPSTASGTETFASGTTAAGGTCSSYYAGFLPAVSIGRTPTESGGFALDSWGNRIRYAVAQTGSGTCTVTPGAFTTKPLKITCAPSDLDVCTTATCAARAATAGTVAFVVFSLGKNGSTATSSDTDEAENTDGDVTFVYKTPTGTFDDILTFIPASLVYSKLISAGKLP